MARTSYLTIAPQATNQRAMAEVLANAMLGNLNIGGEAMLNGTTQVLQDSRIGGQSLLLFMALSSAGAAILPTMWISNRGKGVATLNHASCVNVGVEYVIVG